MAKYVPKVGDVVFVDGKGMTRFVVTRVDNRKKTADVLGMSGVIALTRDVPCANLHHLDESQNALRTVGEATEDK